VDRVNGELEASQFFGYFTTAIAGLAGTIVTLGGALVYLVKGILKKHETSQEAMLNSHNQTVAALLRDSEANRQSFRDEVDGCQRERAQTHQALLNVQQNLVDVLTNKLIVSQSLCPPEAPTLPTLTTTTTTQRS